MRNTLIRRLLAAAPLPATLLAILIVGFHATALAHHGGSGDGLGAGFGHPFNGLDHVLAMVAVGLWASQLERPACWLLPVTFPAVMAIGAVLAIGGLALPWVEFAIATSVLVLGAVITFGARPSVVMGTALISLFALYHGHSHGTEAQLQHSAVAYGVGFIVATFALHAIGLAIGVIANHAPVRHVARTAGAAIASAGVILLAAV